MADPIETAGLVVGGGVGWKALEFVFARFVSRADKAREAVELEVAAKLDRVLADLNELKTASAAAREREAAAVAAVAAIGNRVEGISANHAARLAKLEELTVRLDERLKHVERVKGEA